jgi:hypothetical protein
MRNAYACTADHPNSSIFASADDFTDNSADDYTNDSADDFIYNFPPLVPLWPNITGGNPVLNCISSGKGALS